MLDLDKVKMEKFVCLCVILLIGCVESGMSSCGFPGAPAHSSVEFSDRAANAAMAAGALGTSLAVSEGTIAEYTCDRGFELLGPARRVCANNGTWSPQGIPFCVLNVAAGKAPMQSSVAEGGIPQKAVDGSTSTFFDISTCSLTEVEKSPWWYVNLLEPYMVQLVRIDFGQSCCAKGRQATIVVRVGNNRPDLGVNPICNRFTGVIEEGRPLFLPCNPPMPGAFVSVHFEGPPGVSLSICEAFVYTDQALPIERCPTFRDHKPGSTATYNGKCYIFYNQEPKDFETAKDFCEERGGSLVDESNPALQGFLSWELWRRHRGDPNGQYWLGVQRDQVDNKNWRWINGKSVTVSFWNLPGGNNDCARFDGTKGWLWSDTSCERDLNFICQHRPTTCGKPEQPPNSTLVSTNYDVASRIEYLCDAGHLLVGPARRTCLATGFYSEFPPVCRYIECGMPADIPNGKLIFVNGTREFESSIKYECNPGYLLVGRETLMCDVDQRWNGPPPRFGTVATFYCTNPTYELVGPQKITCLKDGTFNAEPPTCEPGKENNSVYSEPPRVPDSPRLPDPITESTKPEVRPYIPRRTGGPYKRRKVAIDGIEEEITEEIEISTSTDEIRIPYRKIKKKVNREQLPEPVPPRRPEDNEIPGSSNILSSEGAAADIISPTSTKSESSKQQLNLGGIIALGVFGGFVFLAAIITTIVILIRRKDVRPRDGESSFRSTSLESEVDREHSEMVVNSHAHNKHGGGGGERRHHHRHHHHHKHRSHSHSRDTDGGGAARSERNAHSSRSRY